MLNPLEKHVTFLHTSPVHVETFEGLMTAVDPNVKVEHVICEELLADAQRLGADDPSLITRVHETMTKAASTGASIVVCTCSTIGGAAERTPTDGSLFQFGLTGRWQIEPSSSAQEF